LLGFSTASSEAAYPVTMAQLEKLQVSKKIISFVLPMGYSFNLDGSMMYCTFATIFISQAYNIATTKSGDQYHVVGEYLSYDPYGLMYRPRMSCRVLSR
jgi:Na+/H+-dicarboxylate symporter